MNITARVRLYRRSRSSIGGNPSLILGGPAKCDECLIQWHNDEAEAVMSDSTGGFAAKRADVEGISLSQLALGAGLILVGMGQTLLYALLGPAIRQLGLTEVQAGAIVAASALVLTVASPFWGRRIDKVGSRFVFLVGMTSYAIGSVAFAYVLDTGGSLMQPAGVVFFLLLVIRVTYAFLTAGIHPSAMANIAVTTSPELKPARMALMSACFGIGSTLGPLLGSALGGLGLMAPLYAVSFMALLSVALGSVVLKDPPAAQKVEKSEGSPLSARDSRVFGTLVATVLVYSGFSALQQSISFHVQDTLHLSVADAVKQTGIVVSGLAAAMAFTQLVVLQFFKPGHRRSIALGSGIAFVGLVGIALGASTVLLLTLCAIAAGCGFAFIFPGLQGSLSNSVEKSEQGSVAGLSFGAAAFGYVIGPLLGTSLLSVGHGLTYWCAAGLIALCAYVAIYRRSMDALPD